MDKVIERINNIKIEPTSATIVYSKEVQDKSKDYYQVSDTDLQKLFIYKDKLNSLSIKDPFALDQVTGPTVVLTLNRPTRLNVLNTWLFENLNRKFQNYTNDSNLKLMIIKGAGTKGYCAGGDVVELSGQTKSIGPLFPRYFFTKEYNLDITAATVNKPRVAFWDGISMGGGLGISIHSEFRVVTERTLWAMPEVKIGLFPDVGATYFLPRLDKDGIANYIALTAEMLNGLDCMYFGIATHMVKSSDIPILEQKLINTMIDIDKKNLSRQETLNIIDQVINEFQYKPSDPFDTNIIRNWKELSKYFSNSHATLDDIMKSLEQSNTDLAKSLITSIRKFSPTSLKVAFNQVKYGAKLSLLECFKLEYRLAIRTLSNNEFIEGVRALLVDKDNKPKWNPPTLEQVTDEYINHYFSPMPQELPIGNHDIYMQK